MTLVEKKTVVSRTKLEKMASDLAERMGHEGYIVTYNTPLWPRAKKNLEDIIKDSLKKHLQDEPYGVPCGR